METLESLQNYGLTEKQAKVYLACLELGTAPITQIAKKARLKRPTVYLIVDELLKQHLLIEVPQEKKIYYKALEPQKLINLAENRKRQIENILPDLKHLYNQNSAQPKIRFYEGRDKLFQVYEEVFRSKEIWGVFNAQKYTQIFTAEDDQHFYRLLNRAGGIIYDMFEDSAAGRKNAELKFKKGLRQTKILPKNFKLDVDIMVYKNKVVLISFESLSAVIIEEKSIAQSQRQFLKFLWEKI